MELERELRAFNAFFKEMDDLYHDLAIGAGLSDSAFDIFYTLRTLGEGCLQRDVCSCSFVSKQTVNSALRKLEADGILYLEPSGARSKRVCLTEAGLRVADATAGRLIRLENSIFDEWPAEDVQQYLGLMERYLQAFRCKLPELGGQE